jgi:hypothetical protein
VAAEGYELVHHPRKRTPGGGAPDPAGGD